jgi:hypothetical protein
MWRRQLDMPMSASAMSHMLHLIVSPHRTERWRLNVSAYVITCEPWLSTGEPRYWLEPAIVETS